MKRHTMLAALAVGLSMMGATAHAGTTKKASAKQISGVINLNQASAAQLDMLPGVGPKAADRIIAFRAKTPFTRPEDLVRVKGFGKKKLEKLRGHLTVAGPTTLKVSTGKEDPGAVPDTQMTQGRSSPSFKH
jgi:competence protein ComEA